VVTEGHQGGEQFQVDCAVDAVDLCPYGGVEQIGPVAVEGQDLERPTLILSLDK